MLYTLTGELPKHIYCWVDSVHTHRNRIGFVPAVWYGLVSYPGRMWGCTVLLQSGAIYRNIPPHGIAFSQNPISEWLPQDSQTWDCYGLQFTALQYSYLNGLECKVKANNKEHVGQYLFTVAPVGDGFSAEPEQAKEFTFIRLDNGRLTIQPTNHTVFRERSFTDESFAFPKGLARQTAIWSVE